VRYAILLALIDAAFLVAYAVVSFYRARGYATWAVRASEDSNSQRVPAVALVTPLIPLLLFYSFHLDAAVAFLVAALFGVLVTRPALAVQRLVAAAIRGVEDVAPAVLLFMGIGMLLVATTQPQFVAALRPLVAGGWLRSPVAYVMLFGVGSPLVLYRGPLNPFGVGIAIFTVLLTAHVLPPVILVAAVMAVVQVQNVCDPTNTRKRLGCKFHGSADPNDYPANVALPNRRRDRRNAGGRRRRSPAFRQAGIYVRSIRWRPRPRRCRAFTLHPHPAIRIAVDDDGTPFGRTGADVVAAELTGGPWTAMRIHDDPNSTDCSTKRYAAYLRVGSSTFALTRGDDLDIGLRLEDCGGWIVDEWHDHARDCAARRRKRGARAGKPRRGATARVGAFDPVRSGNLFALGAAVRPEIDRRTSTRCFARSTATCASTFAPEDPPMRRVCVRAK